MRYEPDVFPANPFFNNQFQPSIRNHPVLAASSPIVASQQRQGKKRRVEAMQDDDEDIPIASGSQHQVLLSTLTAGRSLILCLGPTSSEATHDERAQCSRFCCDSSEISIF
jgi:hypothetical protein